MVAANCWAREPGAPAVLLLQCRDEAGDFEKRAAVVYGDIRRLLLPDHNGGDLVRQGIDLLIDCRTIRGGDVGHGFSFAVVA